MNAASRDRVLFVLALFVGASAWFGVSLFDARREAWDSPLFWSWALPALVLGTLFACAAVSAGGGLSLWPLTLGLLGLMAAVGLLPTYIGVGLRRLSDARRARRAAADARLKAFLSETPPPPPA